MSKNKVEFNLNDTVNKGITEVKDAVQEANNFVYSTTEDVVNFSIKRGAEWQSVSEKAVKGGLHLSAKQQDLVFDTLEVFKKQFVGGAKRFGQLFSKN